MGAAVTRTGNRGVYREHHGAIHARIEIKAACNVDRLERELEDAILALAKDGRGAQTSIALHLAMPIDRGPGNPPATRAGRVRLEVHHVPVRVVEEAEAILVEIRGANAAVRS